MKLLGIDLEAPVSDHPATDGNYGGKKSLDMGYTEGALCDQNHEEVAASEDEPPPM